MIYGTLVSVSFRMAAMVSSFVPPPPCPRSPPVYPDLSGCRREIVKIQVLEREISLLQEELKLIQGVHLPASTCCKEVVESIDVKSDPFVPTKKKKRRSKGWGVWKWICKSGCLMLPWMGCCCSGCGCGCMKMWCGWWRCCSIPSCSACSCCFFFFPCSCTRMQCPGCTLPHILKCCSCKPSCSCNGVSGCSCFSCCCPKCIRPSHLLCSSNSTTCTCTCTNPVNFSFCSSCCCCLSF